MRADGRERLGPLGKLAELRLQLNAISNTGARGLAEARLMTIMDDE